MISAAHPIVSWLMWITAGLLAVFLALPLLLVPMRWANAFGWQVPLDTRVATYLGRCLGAVGSALLVGLVRAAPEPAAHPIIFEVAITAAGLLLLVHIYGAIERSQPWLETAEIALYFGLTVAFALIYRNLF